MSEKDWDRHAFCPGCGNKTVVTVAAEVQNKQAFAEIIYPCTSCGTPMSLVEGKGKEEPDTPVEVDTSGGVIQISALIRIATADVEQATGGTLSADGKDVADFAVRSTVEALEALQVLPKGAVEK